METTLPPAVRVDYESTPLTRAEYIAAMVHLYRGELHRSNSWRLRLDHTTNWAVITTAGLLTFSFGDVTHSHWTLLIGLALISIFLIFEARRFRYAHMWRSRVRMIEENFYGPILRRDLRSPAEDWGRLVAEDMFRPRFKISRYEAVRLRLRRNYWVIYAVLVLAWGIKVIAHPVPLATWSEIRGRLAMGVLPWWLPLVYLAAFVLSVVVTLVCVPRSAKTELQYWSGPILDGEVPPLPDR